MLKTPKDLRRAKGNHQIPFYWTYRFVIVVQWFFRLPLMIKRLYEVNKSLFKRSRLRRSIKKNLAYAESQQLRKNALAIARNMVEDR
jgi:hypothetical protein